VQEVNGRFEDWQKRVQYLADAKRAPEDAAQAVVSLHEALQAEIERSVQAGEPSKLADELERKRDDADRTARATRFQDTIDAAQQQVEIAATQYADLIQSNWQTLLSEVEPSAAKVTAEYVKAHDELEAKLGPIRERWGALWSQSRQIVGHVQPFTRGDLPEPDEYTSLPLPRRA